MVLLTVVGVGTVFGGSILAIVAAPRAEDAAGPPKTSAPSPTGPVAKANAAPASAPARAPDAPSDAGARNADDAGS